MQAEIGKRYRHYKNQKEYEVTGFAHHTETGEAMVLYRPLYEPPQDLQEKYSHGFVFARPREIFEETLECNGELVDRFTCID